MSKEAGQPAQPDQPARPLLRVVSGNPSDDEIAALVAVLAARSSAAAAAAAAGSAAGSPAGTSTWTDRAALVRAPVRHGPGGWRASGRPR